MAQCLWGHACDGMPTEPSFNDKTIVLDAAHAHVFYNGYGSHSVWSEFSSAFQAVSGVPYPDSLQGWAVSYIVIPVSEFTGSLKFEAVLRGRRVYDSRQDPANNYLLQSDGYWANSSWTLTANAIAAPDGSVTATKIEGKGIAAIYAQTLTAPGSTLTFSVYTKVGAGSAAAQRVFGLYNNTTANDIAFVEFTYASGTITGQWGTHSAGATATAIPVGAGWYRIVMTFTTGITTGHSINCYAGSAGETLAAGNYWHIWGAQLRVGTYAGGLTHTGASLGSQSSTNPATWTWSDNPSLCDSDFLANFCGKTVDWTSVSSAANANDELVSSEKRRTLNVTFRGRENAKAVAETLRAYSATFHVAGPNGIKLIPDRPGSPVAAYRHADGQIISVKVSKKDTGSLPTESEVVYTNRSSTPWRDDSVFVAVAGVGTTVPRRLTSLKLPGVNRYSQAEREAYERLNKMRTSDMSVTVEVFDIGIQHEEGDIAIVNHPLWNLDKQFRVGNPEPLPNGAWRLSCAEYDPAGYSNTASVGPTYPDTGFTDPTLAPATPTGLTHTFGQNGVELSWNANPEFTVIGYELRVGTSWETAGPLIGGLPTIVNGTTFIWPPKTAASYTIWIKAVSGIGRYSTTAASRAVTISVPVMNATLTTSIEGGNYVLSWALSSSDFPISFFRVKKAGVEIAQLSANHYTAPVDWSGDKLFAVSAVDIAGNESSAASATLTINGPGEVASFSSNVMQNTVLFYWSPPAISPLPIASYEMKRGSPTDDWNSAASIGSKSGDQTFTTYFEANAGTYRYFIRPVDTAGIAGPSVSLTQVVAGVSNFQLLDQWNHTAWDGTKTGAVVWDGKLLLPVNATETFTDHFSGAYSTPEGQINAGYPLYIEPTASSGSYEVDFDYGTTLTSAMVTFTYDETHVGSPTFTPHLEKWTGSSWVAVGDVAQAVVSGFSKIRAKLTVSSSGGDDLVTLNSITLRLDVQTESDGGSDTFASGSYKTVTFNKDFIDVSGITVTPLGTSSTKVFAVVEFNDQPYPSGFNVYLYDTSGTLAYGDFSWTAVGVI
jgi:hypothetical protein